MLVDGRKGGKNVVGSSHCCCTVPESTTLFLFGTKSYPILYDCSTPGSSIHGISQGKEYWSGLPFPPPGDLPDPWVELTSLYWQLDSLPLSHNTSPESYHIVVQSLNHVQFFAMPWTAAHQASLSFTISQSLLKLMSIQLMICHISTHFIYRLLIHVILHVLIS